MIVLKDPQKFFDVVRQYLFRDFLTEEQVQGINSIINAWDVGTDSRWVAYSLATAYWETGQKMQPDREIDQGHGRAYGEPVGPNNLIYYGRGLVQLTWLANYEKMEKLIPGSNLVAEPDNALKPDVAAQIMTIGMTKGVFTGRTLGDYFWGPHSDWVDARRIINRLDKAWLIAGYATHFYHAMEEA